MPERGAVPFGGLKLESRGIQAERINVGAGDPSYTCPVFGGS